MNIGSQEEEGVPPDNAMDIDEEDSAAWNGTKGTANCGDDKALPLGDIRWGIAATTGALHWWHLDSEGFGTYIDTRAGLKWWIVGRRKGDSP